MSVPSEAKPWTSGLVGSTLYSYVPSGLMVNVPYVPVISVLSAMMAVPPMSVMLRGSESGSLSTPLPSSSVIMFPLAGVALSSGTLLLLLLATGSSFSGLTVISRVAVSVAVPSLRV